MKEITKKNLKGVLRAAAFCAVFVLIFTQLSVVFDPKDGRDSVGLSRNVTYSYRAEEKNTLDVVFIGNSNAYRAFNPVQLWEDKGITSCVIGKPMMSVDSAYRILKDVLKNQTPKLIVFETNCLYYYLDENKINQSSAASSDLPNTARISVVPHSAATQEQIVNFDFNAVEYNSTFLKDSITFLNDALLSKVAYVSPLMKYHDRWSKLTYMDFTNRNGQYYYITKGFLYSKTEKPFRYGSVYMGSPTDSAQKISSGNLKYFDKIVNLCSENSIKLALVTVPSGTNWNYKRHNMISSLAKQYSLDYTDYNTEISKIGFNWLTDTKDCGNHLNISGAKKIMSAYESELERFGIGRSDIGNSQIKMWNENAKKYHNEIEK